MRRRRYEIREPADSRRLLRWLTLPLAIIFFLLEVGLVATLQAFIFATLASIYFGEATAAHH